MFRFSTNRDLARDKEGIELMGLDHPIVVGELRRWQGLVPEEIGVSVEGDGARSVVSWWMIEARGRNGEHRSHVQPLAVDFHGKRIVQLEHNSDEIFQRPVTRPVLSYADRVRLLREHIEPMLQRHLHHRGLVPENGGYSASLIGWVEVGPAA